MVANEESIRRKKEARDAERKEMEDILIYQAMKDAELAKREEEEAALEHAKKERQAKLLAQQGYYSLTHSLTQSLTHSLTHSRTCPKQCGKTRRVKSKKSS